MAIADPELGYDEELDPAAEQAPASVAENLAAISEYDGNLLDLMDENAITKLGAEAKREYDFDEGSRKEWKDGVERAIKAAKQNPEDKEWPFQKAANIKFPLLTSAAIQFGSRAYGALTRGDQPTVCKVLGSDPDGMKAKKATRITRWNNYQLMYAMDEWDKGTDRLLHTLPVTGCGFRKLFWNPSLGRAMGEFARAQDVVVHNEAASFDRAPRQTQPVNYYPFEIEQMIKAGKWAPHDYDRNQTEDTQRPICYLEQLRYIDLDGDGLQEPYIVTVHEETETAVRLDPAFYPNSLMVTEMGDVETVMRESPWIDYPFLPDIEGSVYGMGFGQLLESLGSAVNANINQILDAGTRQNTGGGFVASSLRLKGARGGTMRVNPGEYKIVNAGSMKVADGIHTLQFPGPSPVQFQLVEFLLGAAQDITAVKDVLTGDAPSGQAMGATLALIEQGLQVFSTIYTRIYRSMRRELRLLNRLNGMHLNPQAYLQFHDDPELMQMVQQGYDPLEDFNMTGMDLAPSADPKSVTDMQRMMRAQYLAQFKGQPGINNKEIQKRELEAANIEDIDKLFTDKPDPAMLLEQAEKEANVEKTKAETKKILTEIDKVGAEVVKTQQEADKTRQEAHNAAFERGTTIGAAGGLGELDGSPLDGAAVPMPGADEAGADSPMAIPVPGAPDPGGLG